MGDGVPGCWRRRTWEHKYETQPLYQEGAYQACTEVGHGHKSKGGEEESPPRDLRHKQRGQAENMEIIKNQFHIESMECL